MKKIVVLSLLWAVMVNCANAQFFKKILDNVKQTAQNRADSKASQTTDKAIDKVLQPGGDKTRSATGTTGAAGQPGTTGALGNLGANADTSSIRRVLGAFAGAAADNPNDTSSSDLTMKALGRLIGGGGVSKADSDAAIQLFKSSQGGSGVYYESVTTITTKSHGTQKDTNSICFTNNGEGRSEMTLPIPGVKTNKMVVIGRVTRPGYSILLDDAKKTYSLNVIDTALINGGGEKYTVTRVGEETVLGYRCVHSKLTSRNALSTMTMDLWTSTSVTGYEQFKKLMSISKVTPAMVAALDKAGCNGYVVKLMSGDKDYTMTMELIKAQERSLPASLFRIPSGYTAAEGGFLGSMLSGAKKN